MSNEETKEGGAEIALTEEERLYKAAKRRYEEAGNDLDEAMSALNSSRVLMWSVSVEPSVLQGRKKWKAQHEEEGFSPLNAELQALEKRVNDATLNFQIFDEALQNVERRWKDTRATAEKSSKRQKVEVSDVWMKDLKEKIVEIPEDIDKLRLFLQQELRVKIPCSQRISCWIKERDTEELCVEVCQKLFEPFDGEMTLRTSYMVCGVIDPTVSESEYATKETYHHLWDSLIATVLTRVSYGCFSRNSNTSTSIRLRRPDLCFYYNKLNICVFRGEEKAVGELIVPLNELHEKLDKWIYDDAPYFIYWDMPRSDCNWSWQ